MRSIPDLHLLVDKYAALLPTLDTDGDEQEEYGAMILRPQNQVERATPNETFVDQCLIWLERATTRASRPLQGNAA
jgi:hypothetical protein